MSHTDPRFMIPVGTVIVVGCLLLLWKPHAMHSAAREYGGWARMLERLLGRRAALWLLRAAALVTAYLTGRAVVHALQPLVGV